MIEEFVLDIVEMTLFLLLLLLLLVLLLFERVAEGAVEAGEVIEGEAEGEAEAEAEGAATTVDVDLKVEIVEFLLLLVGLFASATVGLGLEMTGLLLFTAEGGVAENELLEAAFG